MSVIHLPANDCLIEKQATTNIKTQKSRPDLFVIKVIVAVLRSVDGLFFFKIFLEVITELSKEPNSAVPGIWMSFLLQISANQISWKLGCVSSNGSQTLSPSSDFT